MFDRFKEVNKGKSYLPLFLLIFIIIWSGLALVSKSVFLRDYRMENMVYALYISLGMYTFFRISKTIGMFVLYIGIISLYTFNYELDSFAVVIAMILFYLGITFFYAEFIENKGLIYDSLIMIVAVNVVFQILQYFHIYFVSYPLPGTERFYCGLMNNVNDLSALYAICLPAFLRKDRWYYLPIVLFGLYLSVTLNGMFVALTILSLYLIIKTKNPRIGFMCIVLALSILSFYMIKVDKFDMASQKRGRLYIWEQTFKIASIKKAGWGINQFDKVMPLITSYKYIEEGTRQYLYALIYDKDSFEKALKKASNNDLSYFQSDKLSKTWFVQAHNEYLETYFIGGWIGLILTVGFLLRHLCIAFKQKDEIPFYGLLSACLTAIFFFTWHIVPMVMITILYLGLIRGEKIYQSKVDCNLYDHGR